MRIALAALLLLALNVEADELGRLFTTSEQRSLLDRSLAASARHAVRLEGVILRDGVALAGIGGRWLRAGETLRGTRVISVEAGGVVVLPPGARSPVALRVGESWHEAEK